MSRARNWDKARADQLVRERGADPIREEERPAGISNAQAKVLGQLCRQLGRPYCGSGMTAAQAKRAIEALRRGTS